MILDVTLFVLMLGLPAVAAILQARHQATTRTPPDIPPRPRKPPSC